jgi:hypothetical protein
VIKGAFARLNACPVKCGEKLLDNPRALIYEHMLISFSLPFYKSKF